MSLSEAEIEALAGHECALNNLRAYLFVVTRPTFDAFCSVITRGQSSRGGFTSRKLFREHIKTVFQELATYGAFTTRDEENSLSKFSFIKQAGINSQQKIARESLKTQTELIELSLDVFGHGLRSFR